MAITLLTEANLSFLKRELRRMQPDVRSCHLTEAIAAGLGFNTHSALLAQIQQHPAHVPAVADVSDELLRQRSESLCGRPVLSQVSLEALVRHAEMPDRPWVQVKHGDLEAQNAWFRVCDARCRPYVYVSQATKYARLDWDCITYGGVPGAERVWEVAKGAGVDDNREVKFLWDEFTRVCNGFSIGAQNPTFYGSFFTGNLNFLSPAQAMELADVYFRRLYALVQQYPPKPSSAR